MPICENGAQPLVPCSMTPVSPSMVTGESPVFVTVYVINEVEPVGTGFGSDDISRVISGEMTLTVRVSDADIESPFPAVAVTVALNCRVDVPAVTVQVKVTTSFGSRFIGNDNCVVGVQS